VIVVEDGLMVALGVTASERLPVKDVLETVEVVRLATTIMED